MEDQACEGEDCVGEDEMSALSLSTLPVLPLDVYGVIAEFLAGAHAFGSLSCLNLLNHAIHDESLPVLYGTLTMDHPRDRASLLHLMQAKSIPRRYLYVKYIVVPPLRFGNDGTHMVVLHDILPRLAMILSETRIFVLRPMGTFTAFGIITRTPIYTASRAMYRGGLERRPNAPTSRGFRTISQLDAICFRNSGRFVTDTAADYKSNINTLIEYGSHFLLDLTFAPTGIDFRAESILEILKIGGLEIAKSHKTESNHWNEQSPGRVALSLSQDEVQGIAQRLPSALMTCPEIMLNRIQITVPPGATIETVKTTLETIQAVYQDHKKSLNLLRLPLNRPYIMVEMDIEVKGKLPGRQIRPVFLLASTRSEFFGRLALYHDGMDFTFEVEMEGAGTRFDNLVEDDTMGIDDFDDVHEDFGYEYRSRHHNSDGESIYDSEEDEGRECYRGQRVHHRRNPRYW